jgi:hypothetical protein
VVDIRETIFIAHRVVAAFLLTDLDLAMAFLDLADESGNPESSRRNHNNARKAYDSALNTLPKLSLTTAEESAIVEGLFALRIRLKHSRWPGLST